MTVAYLLSPFLKGVKHASRNPGSTLPLEMGEQTAVRGFSEFGQRIVLSRVRNIRALLKRSPMLVSVERHGEGIYLIKAGIRRRNMN